MDRRLFTGARPMRLKWFAIAWIAAEIAIFAALVRTLGFGATVLLGLATTVLGVMMLRRLGTAALFSLRGGLGGRPPPDGALAEGMLGGLAAILLIVPGFLANFAGLALSAPSVRRRVLASYGGDAADGRPRMRKSSPDVLDLGPADWRVVDRS